MINESMMRRDKLNALRRSMQHATTLSERRDAFWKFVAETRDLGAFSANIAGIQIEARTTKDDRLTFFMSGKRVSRDIALFRITNQAQGE